MKKRLCLVIDQERCIGCEACTVACKIENKAGKRWIRVETENSANKDTPSGRFPELKMSFMPRLCNHCENPPCVEACPPEALQKRDDGPVLLDSKKCDGCQNCIEVCPYEAIFYNAEKEQAEKCSLCYHRVDKDLEPFCVICCEGQAMHFGDLNDLESVVAGIIASGRAFQLLPEEGADPLVYYCPPKASRGL
ncbi:MAG: 4Fe-4S dicluster domain-containing protein [Deltaproteobacteria bacterium]|nr:4Fe-4S dicluster domain-containing protein [Deltaproteobacteria bacterium]